MNPQILDPACGSRMFYFDKQRDCMIYGDSRTLETTLCDGRLLSVSPDVQMDFRSIPFPDGTFRLVVFDPPHLTRGSGWQAQKYGVLPKNWDKYLSEGFAECWRVLKPGGTLILKWNETHIKIGEILRLLPQRPLLGQRTTKNLLTHWMVFYKEAEK